MANYWSNPDGLRVTFGPRDIAGGTNERPIVRTVRTSGAEHELVVDFDYSHLGATETAAPTEWWDNDASGGTTPDSPSKLHAFIPANSRVVECKVYVETAFAGATTDLIVGLYQSDGSTIDADGLVTATEGDIANLTAGAVIVGAGALATNDDVGTADAYIGAHAAGAGTMTAGTARLWLKYVRARG